MHKPNPATVDFLIATIESAADQFDRLGQRLNAARLRAIAAGQRPLGTVPPSLSRGIHIHGFCNVYRAGWFHRAGKPLAFDRHAGDLYPTRESAVADISPASHYVDTVPVSWMEPGAVLANPAHSEPIPLSLTRRLALPEEASHAR
jgi:hypothetical protein